MDGLVLRVTGRTKAGRRDELLQLFEEHLAPRAEANDAQPLVVWVASNDDPDGFELFEIYRDGAAADENARTPWFAAYVAASTPVLAAPPSMTMGTPRWLKGIAL